MLLTLPDVRRTNRGLLRPRAASRRNDCLRRPHQRLEECRRAGRVSGGARRCAASAQVPSDDWTGLTSGVIARMRAENHESLRSRGRAAVRRSALVWIALASTTATFLCGAIACGTLHFASRNATTR